MEEQSSRYASASGWDMVYVAEMSTSNLEKPSRSRGFLAYVRWIKKHDTSSCSRAGCVWIAVATIRDFTDFETVQP
jgi:hypothetical protein